MEELNVINAENNVKIYKKYKMFAYDFLFYYAINVMYWTMTKGFSMAQVMYITAFYSLFTVFCQIPANFISEKIGLKNSVVFGNVLIVFYAVMILFGTTYESIIFYQFLCSLGFTLKSLGEGTLLYASLKKLDKRTQFSKIEGKANSKYYYYDAIASILAGFLFVVNEYIPIILCVINAAVALKMSLGFKNIVKEKTDEEEEKIKLKDTIKQFKLILNSNRAKSIFLYAFVFAGIITVFGTLYKAILIELGIQTQYITMIICIYTVLFGLGAKSVYYIEKQTKNKTLTIFGILYVLGILIIGLCGIINELNLTSLSIIIISLCTMGLIQGAYRVVMKKYVLSFTTTEFRTKITSAYYIFENVGAAITSFIIGIILDYTTSSRAAVIFACISFLIMIWVLMFMKNKLGLKPEEYDPKEIYNRKI